MSPIAWWSAGRPNRSTGMITRGTSPSRRATVTARRALSGAMLKVSASTSANTGVAPSSATTSAVAQNVNDGTDHRIAGADALGHQYHQQRVGAAGAGYRMAGPAKRRQCGFEFPHLGSEHELTMIEHARDRRIDAAAQAAPLRRHVDERNGRGGDPGVLVHERTSAARARRGAATATRRVDFAANSAG